MWRCGRQMGSSFNNHCVVGLAQWTNHDYNGAIKTTDNIGSFAVTGTHYLWLSCPWSSSVTLLCITEELDDVRLRPTGAHWPPWHLGCGFPAMKCPSGVTWAPVLLSDRGCLNLGLWPTSGSEWSRHREDLFPSLVIVVWVVGCWLSRGVRIHQTVYTGMNNSIENIFFSLSTAGSQPQMT